MRQLFAVVLAMFVLSSAQPSSAQSGRAVKPAFASELSTSDSLYLGDVAESPDGHWLVFASPIRSGPSHIWLMPLRGGTPHRLTDGAYDDLTPVWFPSGRRIAFSSTRVRGVMTADVDVAAGRLVGVPKRVSLEDGHSPDVSPDGARIVYVDQRNRLRLIPSTGGPAVTLLDHSGAGKPGLTMPGFSRDGKDVYVSAYNPERRTTMLLRVSASGGPATTALNGPPDGLPWSIVADPTRDRVMTYSPTRTSILTLSGDTIATMPAIRGGIYVNFSRDGHRVYKATGVTTAVVRVLPTGGGKPIDVTNGKSYDYPLTWSADSKRLYSTIGDTTITRKKAGLYLATVEGTERRFLELAELDTALAGPRVVPRYVSADGDTWWITPMWSRTPFSILAYDTRARSTHVVTRTAMGVVRGSGGFNVAPELLYVEQRRGDGPYQLRSIRGSTPSAPLHDFSHLGAPWGVAVAGDRLAFGVRVGDSTVLYTARFNGPERRLMAFRGDVLNLAWSLDRRALAGVVSPPASGNGAAVLFVRVGDDGRLSGTPRSVPTGAAWDLAWQPDNRSVLVLEEQGSTDHTRVLRVPMDERQQPVSITPNETRTFWDQYPSPDGKYVAIPVEQFGSSTLWSIDVDEAAKAWRAKREKP